MAPRDDLDQLIDEFAQTDPEVRARVDAALERRVLARELAARRREAGLTQVELARRMGTSQAQVTRFESGADTRMSTVGRYAAALGVKLGWTITAAHPTKTGRKHHQSAPAPRKRATA